MSADTLYFYRTNDENGYLSQWYESNFTTSDGLQFATTEQYMMYNKAHVFNDVDIAKKILTTPKHHPNYHRKLGRSVKNFNEKTWYDMREEIVYNGNMMKFEQNKELLHRLMDTSERDIVEASPYDRVWGIGFNSVDAPSNVYKWGRNLLGKTIMRVRSKLKEQHCCDNHSTATMSGNLTWSKDNNWDKPLVKSAGRERFDEIDKWIYRPGLLCRINGGEYVFIDTSNYWANLASDEVMIRINTMIGITNATVQYEKSLKAYLKYIIKRCNANIGRPLPTSICIGTERLELEVDRNEHTLKFYESRPLLDTISKKVNPIVSGVCVMPIDTVIIPKEFKFPGTCGILEHIQKLFPDMRDLTMIAWHIGNSVIDPIARPKSVILCGPGGSGKSTLLQQMQSCLIGCCGTLPDGSLTGFTKKMDPDIVSTIVSSRMAVCYDVNLEHEKLNMNVFKNISGSDYIRVGQISCKSNCSLTLATNGIVNLDQQSDYHTDAIMRRVVCVLMNVAALSIPKAIIPEDLESRIDFICFCVYVRLTFEHMPVPPMALLLTLCASKIDDAVLHIEETSDHIDLFDGMKVLDILSNILKLSAEDIVFKASLISPYCIIDVNGRSVLRGLRTIQ